MALSGSIQTNYYNGSGYKVAMKLSWTATQSVADNTSTINWTASAVSTHAQVSHWVKTAPVTIVINETTVLSITTRFEMRGDWSKSGTLTITHNNDGTKSFSASIRAAIYSSSVNCTASGNFTLDAIPRNPTAPTKVTASTPDGTMWAYGEVATVTWSGATGPITGYEVQSWDSQNQKWEAYSKPTGTSTTCTYLSKVLLAGTTYKFRVRALNGTLASGWVESNALTFSGGMRSKQNGTWKMGSVWINIDGTYKRAKRVWINDNGTWRQSK